MNSKFRPLSAAVTALLGAAATLSSAGRASAADVTRPATITPVTTCDDDLSSGSFREVLLHAIDGDTIDLTALQCSHLSLGYGSLFTSVDNLTINANHQTVSGGLNQNIFTHIGHGQLTIEGLNFGYSRYDGKGGCIYSAGNVYFADGSISDCVASDAGGGIAVMGTLRLKDSVITGNSVNPHQTNYALGGGVYARGNATVVGCEIDGNSVGGEPGQKYSGLGGGLITYGSVDVELSTFAGNHADQGAGGAVYARNGGFLRDSTLSGNSAVVGSAAVLYGSVTIESDTIAFNTIPTQCQYVCHPSALNLRGGGQSLALLSMNNTIAADNDVADVYAYVDFDGANNLIMTSNYSPPDTLHSDPMLGPLATNGSLLLRQPRTHALLPGSPAIDAGNTSTPMTEDERGMPRIVGIANDIGAYEANDDEIFGNGFDGT